MRLIIGRKALHGHLSIPIKTLLTYRSGAPGSVVRRCNGGPDFLEAVGDRRINHTMIDEAVLEHFTLLRDMAVIQANRIKRIIQTIVLSYPNYLWQNEGPDQFQKYFAYMVYIMQIVWGDYAAKHGIEINYRSISEGQAMAVYITELFKDPHLVREKLLKPFQGVDPKKGVIIVVVDCGSTTIVSISHRL